MTSALKYKLGHEPSFLHNTSLVVMRIWSPLTPECCITMASNSLPLPGMYGTICSSPVPELIRWLLSTLEPLGRNSLDDTSIGSIRIKWLAQPCWWFRENSEMFAFSFSLCTYLVIGSGLKPSFQSISSEGYTNSKYASDLLAGGEVINIHTCTQDSSHRPWNCDCGYFLYRDFSPCVAAVSFLNHYDLNFHSNWSAIVCPVIGTDFSMSQELN